MCALSKQSCVLKWKLKIQIPSYAPDPNPHALQTHSLSNGAGSPVSTASLCCGSVRPKYAWYRIRFWGVVLLIFLLTFSSFSSDHVSSVLQFVTEPHAEWNAGFMVLFASTHPAIFDWTQWNPLLDALSDDILLTVCYKSWYHHCFFLALMESYLRRSLSYKERDPVSSCHV